MSPPPSLTHDPIPRLTLRIALPMSVAMFFNTMVNVVDTLFAGWLSTDALAALSLSFPVFFVVIAAGSGLSQGTTALMANLMGASDRDGARHVFAQSLIFASIVGVVLMFAGWVVTPSVFRLLGADGGYLETVLAYMNTLLAGGPFLLLPLACNAALMAQGDTRHYRNFLIGGFVLNCILNPLLMWGFGPIPGMGVAGLALATVLIQVAGTIYLAMRAFRSPIGEGVALKHFRPDYSVLRQIVGQGGPAALNMLTIAVGIFVITWYVQRFGKEAVAAIGIATRIEQIVLLPTIGLNAAVLSIVGQSYGAGLRARVREAWWMNVRAGALLMIIGGLMVGLLRYPAMRLFTRDEIVIGHGADYLLIAAMTLAAYPIIFVTVFAMQGIKKPGYGLWLGLYRQLVAPFIIFHVLAFILGWGLWGIWWGICIVTWSAALFSLVWGWRKFCLSAGDSL